MKVCPVSPDLMDDDWQNIIFEIQMNITRESFAKFYHDEKKKKASQVSDDVMRKLGYSDADILKTK